MKHCKREDIRFVTLEDILGGQQGLNWVIYNPILDKIDNEKILRNVTKHVFRITLTEDDVDELTVFDKYHLHDFIEAYRNMLRRYWDVKPIKQD